MSDAKTVTDRQKAVGSNVNIVIAAAFPPPLHGLAKISEAIACDLSKRAIVRKFDLSAGSMVRSPTYHIKRIFAVLTAIGGVLRNGSRPRRCLYLPADGGFGLLYTILLVIAGRLSRHRIVIHHHSFAAIDRPTRLMTSLMFIAGLKARHVFLCKLMHRQFRKTYPGSWLGMISSNAAHLPLIAEKKDESSIGLTLGLLSNLTREKGLYEFLAVIQACKDMWPPVLGHLAGPIEHLADRAAVEQALIELPERLTYFGPLYGINKDRFLTGLDVFVFATNYGNEAQPNVLFEAMSAGAAIVTFGRGCIAEDVDRECGVVIAPWDDFVSLAHTQIQSWQSDPDALQHARFHARRRFEKLRRDAEADYGNLLTIIAED